jgi:hypothetical protein
MDKFDLIYDDQEFGRRLQQLNALCHGLSKWTETRAAKEHQDEFGRTIASGDMYYKRELGGGFGNDLKFSRQTMDQFLFSLFASNELLQAMADKMVRVDQERMRELVDSLGKNRGES